VSLWVFAFFAFFYLGEKPTWRTAVAFLLIVAAVALIRGDGGNRSDSGTTEARNQNEDPSAPGYR
jgi:drug/metabolite transporter (DMT)-like permease